MAQAVMPKASLEAISFGGGLIVVGILASLGINDNIPNLIPSPSNLWYDVKKSREATLMTIAVFVYNYPFSMSCDKVDGDGPGRLVKKISKTPNTAVGFCGPNLVFESKDVSARSLLTTCAMALLYSGVDRNIIKMIGRWRKDEMLRYLQVQAEPLMRNFYWIMLINGNDSFLLQQEAPCLLP